MTKKRTTFLMQFDWYAMIDQLNTEQKASLLDAIYHYQLYGEIIDTDPIVKIVFTPMLTFFKGSAADYEKTCIKNSLNRHKGWAEKDKDQKREADIQEKMRFLEEHTAEEYRDVYERKGAYTKDTYTNTKSSSESESISESNFNSKDNLNDNTRSGCKGEDYKEREEVTLEQLEKYCSEHGYHFDCRKSLSAKKTPLYRDELASQCEFWESLVK